MKIQLCVQQLFLGLHAKSLVLVNKAILKNQENIWNDEQECLTSVFVFAALAVACEVGLISFFSCEIFSVSSLSVFMMFALSSGFLSRRFISTCRRAAQVYMQASFQPPFFVFASSAFIPFDIRSVSQAFLASFSSCPAGASTPPEGQRSEVAWAHS